MFSPGPYHTKEPKWDHHPEVQVCSAQNEVIATLWQWGKQDIRADGLLLANAWAMRELLMKACAAEASDNAQMLVDFFVEATKLLAKLEAEVRRYGEETDTPG